MIALPQGYNANNLRTHNVTPVAQRNMYLVDRSHPIIAAIQENSQSLQAANIAESPDQLVKISDGLMSALMPLVEEQVRNQIKVADMSKFHMSLHPADYPSWSAAAEALSKEAVMPIRAQQKRALRAAGDDPEKIAAINAQYEARVDEAQQNVATTPLEFSLQMTIAYNFLGGQA
jgi:DNA polymerase III alpha subunit